MKNKVKINIEGDDKHIIIIRAKLLVVNIGIVAKWDNTNVIYEQQYEIPTNGEDYKDLLEKFVKEYKEVMDNYEYFTKKMENEVDKNTTIDFDAIL